jgi:hypothetical protein
METPQATQKVKMKSFFTRQNRILLKWVPSTVPACMKCLFLVCTALSLIVCWPVHAQKSSLRDSVSRVCNHFVERMEAEAGEKKCAVAVGPLLDINTRKSTGESTQVEKLFFTTMLRHYASRANRPLFRLRIPKPLQEAASGSGAYTLPPQARMLQKYGCGFLITGWVSTSGRALTVSAELVDITSGMVVARSGDTAGDAPAVGPEPAGITAPDPALQATSVGRQVLTQTALARPETGSEKPETSLGETREPSLSIEDGNLVSSKDTFGPPASALPVTGERPMAAAEPQIEDMPAPPARPERGVMTGANFRYEGEIREGKRWGTGTLVFDSGDKYTGEWKNGMKEGFGTYSYANGDQYEGQWQQDRMHGHGVYTYKSGSRYEGAFKDGRRHGKGVFYFSNGDRWEGGYLNGKKDGQAVYVWANGQSEPEHWKDGRQVE